MVCPLAFEMVPYLHLLTARVVHLFSCEFDADLKGEVLSPPTGVHTSGEHVLYPLDWKMGHRLTLAQRRPRRWAEMDYAPSGVQMSSFLATQNNFFYEEADAERQYRR